jgi:hypothetical protein
MESTIVEGGKSASSLFSQKQFGVLYPPEAVEKPIKQYLYFAFRRSLRDAEAYENAALGINENDERCKFFKEMADRKREEAEKLYLYYKSDGYRIIKDMKKRSIISHPHYEDLTHASQIASIEDTFSFAFKKEQCNLELYSKLAGLDDNSFTKILFDYLAHLQMGHISFIEKRFSLVNLRAQGAPYA